jgi:hypothetical protein
MTFNRIIQPYSRGRFIVPTADLSALGRYSGIRMIVLKLIVAPNRRQGRENPRFPVGAGVGLGVEGTLVAFTGGFFIMTLRRRLRPRCPLPCLLPLSWAAQGPHPHIPTTPAPTGNLFLSLVFPALFSSFEASEAQFIAPSRQGAQ